MVLALAIALPTAGFAQSLEQRKEAARSQGLIGETSRGYVAAVSGGDRSIQQLVDELNALRRAHYQSIAKRTGSPLSQVESASGERLFAKVPPGTYLMDSSGSWRRK
ncbi:MAG: YdbL family protein [Pirellulales bacterium]|nr:YdbL family protein [Pirellulales bacterium]